MLSTVKKALGPAYRWSAKMIGLLLCAAVSLLFVLFQGGKLSLMIFIMVVVIISYLLLGKYSGVTRVQGRRMLLNAEHGLDVEAGTSLNAKITIQVPGVWPIPYVIVKDRLHRRNGERYEFEQYTILDWRRRGEVEYSTPPLRRGHYHFEPTDCLTEDVFGLFEHKGELELSVSFRVKPRTVKVRKWRQLHNMLKGFHHYTPTTRAIRETTQINGVREYIYGDRISRIHWNATARTGQWKSKEFERESLPKTILLLDRHADAYRSKQEFELAVSVVASLIEYGQGQNLSLGLLSIGGNPADFEPRRSPDHHRAMLDHLVEVEADGKYTPFDVVRESTRGFAAGSFFVIVSPSSDDRMLQMMRWLTARQLNGCHIQIAPAQTPDTNGNWVRLLQSSGFLAYRVRSLAELPAVLGGDAS